MGLGDDNQISSFRMCHTEYKHCCCQGPDPGALGCPLSLGHLGHDCETCLRVRPTDRVCTASTSTASHMTWPLGGASGATINHRRTRQMKSNQTNELVPPLCNQLILFVRFLSQLPVWLDCTLNSPLTRFRVCNIVPREVAKWCDDSHQCRPSNLWSHTQTRLQVHKGSQQGSSPRQVQLIRVMICS